MKTKIITYTYLFLLALAGYLLFTIKSEVQNLNFQISSYKRQIEDDKKNIGMLKAEFAYLTSPKRLGQLVSKHLHLSSITAGQAVADPLSNKETFAQLHTPHREKIITPTNNIQWRYKHAAHRRSNTQVQKASYKRD